MRVPVGRSHCLPRLPLQGQLQGRLVLDQLLRRHRHRILHQRRPDEAYNDAATLGQRLPESLDGRDESDDEQTRGHRCGGEDGCARLGRMVLGGFLGGAEGGGR